MFRTPVLIILIFEHPWSHRFGDLVLPKLSRPGHIFHRFLGLLLQIPGTVLPLYEFKDRLGVDVGVVYRAHGYLVTPVRFRYVWLEGAVFHRFLQFAFFLLYDIVLVVLLPCLVALLEFTLLKVRMLTVFFYLVDLRFEGVLCELFFFLKLALFEELLLVALLFLGVFVQVLPAWWTFPCF